LGRAWRRRLWGWVGIALVLATTSARAEAEPGAESIQIPILLKILTYDRTLMSSPPPTLEIAVVHEAGDTASERNRDALLDTFDTYADKTIRGIPFRVRSLAFRSASQLTQELRASGVHVVYVTAGHEENLEAITHATRATGALSVNGTPGFTERGLSVGVEIESGQPHIHVNLESLRAEGHDLRSSVLRLSQIVGGRP